MTGELIAKLKFFQKSTQTKNKTRIEIELVEIGEKNLRGVEKIFSNAMKVTLPYIA